MPGKIAKIFFLILMILNGLLFVIGVYVLGDRNAAIEMHEDLAPSASAFMASTKVLIGFIVGLLYLVSAYGIIRKKYNLTIAGIAGFAIFTGMYIVELIMWAEIHPQIWISFSAFDGAGFIIGVYSWYNWRKRK